MKERPILFITEMVRALLDGRKTQTRRVMKPQPKTCEGHTPNWQSQILDWVGYKYSNREHWFCHTCGIGLHHIDEYSAHGIICPYGQAGDHLWVRETWADMVCVASTEKGKGKGESNPIYKSTADSTELKILQGHWKPSIFMPRWASRITLEITGIRVQRVQEISFQDITAEGVDDGQDIHYEELWDSINGKKYLWSSNPWVWVIEYKRLIGATA